MRTVYGTRVPSTRDPWVIPASYNEELRSLTGVHRHARTTYPHRTNTIYGRAYATCVCVPVSFDNDNNYYYYGPSYFTVRSCPKTARTCGTRLCAVCARDVSLGPRLCVRLLLTGCSVSAALPPPSPRRRPPEFHAIISRRRREMDGNRIAMTETNHRTCTHIT